MHLRFVYIDHICPVRLLLNVCNFSRRILVVIDGFVKCEYTSILKKIKNNNSFLTISIQAGVFKAEPIITAARIYTYIRAVCAVTHSLSSFFSVLLT